MRKSDRIFVVVFTFVFLSTGILACSKAEVSAQETSLLEPWVATITNTVGYTSTVCLPYQPTGNIFRDVCKGSITALVALLNNQRAKCGSNEGVPVGVNSEGFLLDQSSQYYFVSVVVPAKIPSEGSSYLIIGKYWIPKKDSKQVVRPKWYDDVLLDSRPETQLRSPQYTVKWGDTLTSIAENWGCSVEILISLNGLESDFIREGQVLTLPE